MEVNFMLSTVLEFVGGVLGGGSLGVAVGMLGNWITRREERKDLAVKQAHAVNMRKLDIEESQLEHAQALDMLDKHIDKAKVEGDIAEDVAVAKAFAQSQRYGNQKTGTWTDSVKALMRPLITTYLLAVLSFIAYHINDLVGGLTSLGGDELMELYRLVIIEIIFLAMTAVTWYFGARPTRRNTQ